MGEAKRRLEEVREDMTRVVEGWMSEPTEWEASMVAEVLQLPRVTVPRCPPDLLARMRMETGNCHANAYSLERADPENQLQRPTNRHPVHRYIRFR